jgi:transcriptional regulator with XRE-family HTH domain
VKTKERERARQLRGEQGRAIKDIARLLNVAPSSVSRWVRDVELTPEQHDSLRRANPAYNRQLAGRKSSCRRALERRLEYQNHGRELARRGDPFHAAGCMLFWAEGARSRNQLRFSNSDPAMIRFFMRFLRAYFAIPDDKLRVWCNMHADHAEHQRAIERSRSSSPAAAVDGPRPSFAAAAAS